MRKLKLMLILSVSLLALFTLSACKMLTAHKKITNIKFTEKTFKESGTKTVAKIEYQTVGETEAEFTRGLLGVKPATSGLSTAPTV